LLIFLEINKMAAQQDSNIQEVLSQAQIQHITQMVISVLPSLFMGAVMIINACKRATKPNLAVQLLDNDKKIKLTKLNYQSNLERLNLNYQRKLKSLTIERATLHQQAKLLLTSRNLEVGIGEQVAETKDKPNGGK
jgi:hypothetical protein